MHARRTASNGFDKQCLFAICITLAVHHTGRACVTPGSELATIIEPFRRMAFVCVHCEGGRLAKWCEVVRKKDVHLFSRPFSWLLAHSFAYSLVYSFAYSVGYSLGYLPWQNWSSQIAGNHLGHCAAHFRRCSTMVDMTVCSACHIVKHSVRFGWLFFRFSHLLYGRCFLMLPTHHQSFAIWCGKIVAILFTTIFCIALCPLNDSLSV